MNFNLKHFVQNKQLRNLKQNVAFGDYLFNDTLIDLYYENVRIYFIEIFWSIFFFEKYKFTLENYFTNKMIIAESLSKEELENTWSKYRI